MAWHGVLLRMAGTVPDDLISEARDWLADGHRADVAQALAFAVAASRVPVPPADLALIRQELTASGQDTQMLADLEAMDEDGAAPNPWAFSPVRSDEVPDGVQPPMLLDLSADPAGLDPIDRAVVDAVVGEETVSALWRAWRAPADGSPWPLPRRVFVVGVAPPDADIDADIDPGTDAGRGTEIDVDTELPALAVRLQDVLVVAGESDPQVEVCREDLPMPAYQSAVCAHSALLWAREPARSIQLARVFDSVDPELGPRFDPEHPRIEDAETVDQLLDYLDGALPVLTTSAVMADIIDPDHPEIVPLSFRTDGTWIWTDTVSYYLDRYCLAPDPDLLAHIRATGPKLSPLTDVGLHRVLSFLQRPDDLEPVWIVQQTGGPESRPVPV
jgi:hypothetical protein